MCGAIHTLWMMMSRGVGSSPRVRSDPFEAGRPVSYDGIISACAERSVEETQLLSGDGDHLRVCGAILRRCPGHHLGRRIISACAERSVVFYWDLVRLDGAECLIRTLCGVVEWRCSRYLEWMLSIYVTRASRPRIWGVLVVAGFRKSSERSRALTRRVAPRMNVFLSIIGLIDDRDTITLWGRRYPLGAYPKVDGIRLINEATKGGAHVFHCFVAAY